MTNKEFLEEIKKYFEKEFKDDQNIVDKFSNIVIDSAYEKLSNNLSNMIKNEEDPIIISELLQKYLDVSKAINEKDLSKKQIAIKMFEQLLKYEQSKYR